MVIKRAEQKGITLGYCDTITGQRVYPPPPPAEMTDILPDQQPPAQKPAFYPPSGKDADEMNARITCFPALGQATPVLRSCESVKFTVLLETTTPSLVEDPDEHPAVCLWHSYHGHYDWAELQLHPVDEREFSDILLLSRPKDRSLTRFWFQAELAGLPKHSQVVNFTVKFRLASGKGWKWIKDSTGIDDGELHYLGAENRLSADTQLKEWFKDISEDVKIAKQRAETPKTQLYSLTCPVAPAKGKDSSYQHHRLGMPKQTSRWFALVRLWSPWLAPRQGKGSLKLDKDGILLSFLRTDGLHVVCLAISGIEDVVTTFLHEDDGTIIIKGRNDRETTEASRVLVAVADSFEVANAAVFYHARKVVADHSSLSASSGEEIASLTGEKVKPEWLEEWYEGLTYCTWNGLGQNLTADGVYNALDELARNNINITNLIIDDNWQDLSSGDTQFKRGWQSFEANKKGFPDGLKKTTAEIRKRHPNVNHIAVWHAILGYWGGIAPDSWIANNYKTVEVEKEPGVAGGKFLVVAAEDAERKYDDFYRFLSSSGVDAVKTDAQFFLDMLLHAPDRRALITEYQDAWTLAHLRHFSSRAISCMSQSPQILFHSQLPRNKPRLLVRNSDDFFPEIPASHPWHIFCNAHNALFAQHLNVLPDWDMFQTSHEYAGFHGAARCVSGGPIYITDTPGKHDIALIRQMTAQTTRGKTVILRPTIIGKSIDPYNAYSAQALLKVGTYVGRAGTGTGILGLFNCSGQTLSEFVSLSDFPGTEEGEYVVGSFVGGQVSAPMSRGGEKSMVGAELDVRGWDILTAYPVQAFEVGGKKVKVGVFGLVGKMTGSAAIINSDATTQRGGRVKVWTSLKALGVLGVYIGDLEKRTVQENFMVLIFGKPVPVHCVKISETCSKVLEIVVEKAWKEMGLETGWSNEVSVEVIIS